MVKLCGIVRENIRRTDLFMRYGGEEFCIVQPDAELNISFLISQRIGTNIKKHIFKSKNKKFSITLSIGILEYDKEKNYGPNRFIEEADKLMYRAKKAGKDRICYRDMENDILLRKI